MKSLKTMKKINIRTEDCRLKNICHNTNTSFNDCIANGTLSYCEKQNKYFNYIKVRGL